MDQLCDDFLAGPAFTEDQDIDIDIREQLDLAADLEHVRRRSQKEVAVPELFNIGNSRHFVWNLHRMRCNARGDWKNSAMGRLVAGHTDRALGGIQRFDHRLDVSRVTGMVRTRSMPGLSGFSAQTLLAQFRNQANPVRGSQLQELAELRGLR